MKIIAGILGLFLLFSCSEKEREKGEHLIYSFDTVIAERDNRYALADSCGYLLTDYLYDNLEGLPQGYVLALADDKYFILSEKGERLTPAGYDCFENCLNGVAIVSKGKGVGLLSVSGKEVLPLVYEQIRFISDEIALAQRGEWIDVVHKSGVLIENRNGTIERLAQSASAFVESYQRKFQKEIRYWDGILLQYDSLCEACLAAKAKVNLGHRLPQNEIDLLWESAHRISKKLMSSSGKMTPEQWILFNEITEKYASYGK